MKDIRSGSFEFQVIGIHNDYVPTTMTHPIGVNMRVETIDMVGDIEMEVKLNQHHMTVDLGYFEERIIDYVERNHPMDLTKIVEGWEVPSYNLIKELGNSNGRKTSSYEVFVDKDGWVERIVIMTERNCRFVLDWIGY